MAGFLPGASTMGQSFTSYFTGDTTDMVATPAGGVCMMGGASEDDNAMRWFLQRANGGDVLVLRASGSNGYNAYLYSQLGIPVNSVETIVCHSTVASDDPYVQARIRRAEAIWFAGGDQWNYVSYWRNSPVDSLINQALQQRHIVIGGTSAGMAILGGYYFSAENGTVTSATAMANPYATEVTVDSTHFLENRYLEDVITDTHFDYYGRQGRFAAFLARILTDWGVGGRGIACDEYTAVCIDTNGIAAVYGDHPNNDDNAYFVQVNCEIPGNVPEVCMPNIPLQWDQNGAALKVYAVKGTPTGTNTFDLRDWKTGTGGSWEAWSVYSNAFFANPSTEINCAPVAVQASPDSEFAVWPNPSQGHVNLRWESGKIKTIELFAVDGRRMLSRGVDRNEQELRLDVNHLPAGTYCMKAEGEGAHFARILVLQ